MRFVQLNPKRDNIDPRELQGGSWIENCIEHHIPMRKVFREDDPPFMGIPESMKYFPRPRDFNAWAKNPVIGGVEGWYCEECNSIWAMVLGQWVKTDYLGTILEPIPIERAAPPSIDPGPKPYLEATECNECHVWREPRGDWQVCPKCGTGLQVLTSRVPSFAQQNLTPDDISGPRDNL